MDEIEIEGIAAAPRHATVYAAKLQFAGTESLERVVAFGDEAILGRDLLNRMVLGLDGPGGMLSIHSPMRRHGRRRTGHT